MSAEQALQQLQSLLGSGGLITAAAERTPYEHGPRYGAGQALCVARPADVAQAAELMRLCAAEGVRLVPQGANTGLVGAASPDDSGLQVILSMERIRGVIDIDPIDGVIQAWAGTRLSDLNQALAPHGLCFPIDLGADPSVGGMLAANTGGARLIRYGDVRHNTLGLQALLMQPPGELLEMGNRLHKNNTGPDWKQLFIGTAGSYGIVTQAVLRAHPLPRQRATALVVPSSLEAGLRLLQDAQAQFADFLTAFEGISRNALASVLRHLPQVAAPFDPLPDYALLVEVSSSAEAGEHFDLDKLFMAWLERHFDDAIVDAVVDKPDTLWRLRHAISDSVKQEGKIVAFDISVSRSRLPAFRAEALALVARDFAGADVYDFGHWGDGGVHFNLAIAPAAQSHFPAERIEALRTALYDLVVQRYQGSFSAEHGIGPFNQHYYQRYTQPAQRALAARVQSVFDPDCLLGNTRFA
ncbi:FAD-binding oxidoreductase [Herbaspirillum sp. AP02]|uniref:FAD-binding oxidoreductase n=1 Tax=unclassified Herbaspirillum TaxID=2624150 RepID=UPI0015DA44C2|nr:FAD-binding oxidoreductase [Herbaspirillum sp. AP02]NZD66679.1 FAD-binding oxidoreductase [Herbaspirillum sp. AP21]